MSKSGDRTTEAYWKRRLHRNSYTHLGQRRWVSGWCLKVQWRGIRRTVRLESADRDKAAREALALYEALRRGGWEGVGRWRRGDPGKGVSEGPVLVGVGPRKYVSNLNPGRTRECFATLVHAGETEHVALGTEQDNEARLRAQEVRSELVAGGWDRVRLGWSREVTVAVFWQSNPMACTYTTLLTVTAVGGTGGGGIPGSWAGLGAGTGRGERGRGWRVLVLEPEGAVRRAVVQWLSLAAEVAEVVGLAGLEEGFRPGWHLVLVNQDQVTSGVRTWVAGAGVGGGPAEMLTHGVFRDSDAIFASVSGVTEGYFLRRLRPPDLLEPVLRAMPDGPLREGEWERVVRRYFQNAFDPPAERVGAGQVSELTARESDVVELLRRGRVDKEIARELGISVWTVHSHLKRIFTKYGVRTRTEAVVRHLQK